MSFDIGLDLFPFLAATLAAISCGLLGNFLVLRRLSLMGDAISHSVLPGLVMAFLITSTRNPLVMFLGAAVAGVATVVCVELVKRLGRVESGAAMGVVFSIAFAAGVLLIERAAARQVDLDAECVLHGQLETLVWYAAPSAWTDVFHLDTLRAMPRQVTTLAVTCALAISFVGLFFKELRIAAFDPALATTQGFNATAMHYVLMIFVAAATVASFEAVGSILVIAMLVCPAAIARMLTDRLRTQVLCSVFVAMVCSVIGYFGASAVPAMFGIDSLNAAGSMAIAAGLLLVIAIIASPTHGVIVRMLRRRALAITVATEDLLAALYRASEQHSSGLASPQLRAALGDRWFSRAAAASQRQQLIRRDGEIISLTERGLVRAKDIIRKHRLWELYLVDELGLRPDHVHDTAMRLEHVTGADMQHELVREVPNVNTDPHGKSIPH